MAKAAVAPSSKGNKQPSNEKVNSATASCPKKTNTREPCDIASLTVTDKASGRNAVINKPKHKELAPNDAPARILPMLAKYDAVLELISSAEEVSGDSKDAKEKNVSLALSARKIGTCPKQKHIALKVNPLNSADAEDRHEFVENLSPDPVKVFGRSHATDSGPAKWIAPFWVFGENQVKKLEVSAESCGVLGTGKPNQKLNCLVRVYRDDVYKLTFKVPAFKQIKREWKGEKDIKGTVTRESSYTKSVFGDKVAEESTKSVRNSDPSSYSDYVSKTSGSVNDQGNYQALKSKEGFDSGLAIVEQEKSLTERGGTKALYRDERTYSSTRKITSKDGKTFVFDVSEQKDLKPTISLKRNGSEVNFTKAINDIINLQKNLTDALNQIKNWVPKVGWWVDVDLSLLTGEIEGSWGNRYPKTPQDGERYILIESFYDIGFDIKILEFAVTLGAGIDFSTSGILDWFAGGKVLEVVLKIEGKLSCDVSLNSKLSSLKESKPASLDVVGKADIYAQGRVTVMAVTYEATAGVTGGFEFKGALIGSFTVTPHVSGEIGFVETIAYVTVKKGVSKRAKRFETVIFKKKELWKGKLPSVPSP